jgi:hypothetical protein
MSAVSSPLASEDKNPLYFMASNLFPVYVFVRFVYLPKCAVLPGAIKQDAESARPHFYSHFLDGEEKMACLH